MFTAERQQMILEKIKAQHSATVTELSKQFFISETSVRRDLLVLEKMGLIRRTYGGAILADGENEVIALEARQQIESEAKMQIAQKAAALIGNGQVIFMDSSSTALAIVPFFSKFTSLSVITNGIKAATMLAEYPQIKVYLLGGLLNGRSLSIRGTFSCNMLGNMNANLSFVSPRGIDKNGNVFCADEEEAAVRRIMIQDSEKSVLLCNSKKLGQRGAFRLCHLNDIDDIVCDQTPGEDWTRLIRENHTEIL